MTAAGTSRSNGFTGRSEPAPPAPAAPAVAGAEVLALCDAASLLARSMAHPLQRMSLRSGDCVVELEFAIPPVTATGPAATFPAPGTPAPGGIAGPPGAGDPHADASTGLMVRAPLVGTFYSSSSPGEPPFVQVGDQVTPGQTIGIVEAMKLMNPVVAETGGTVTRILAADATSVEYDQPLIELRPSTPGEG